MKKLLTLLILLIIPVRLWADLTGTEGLAIDLSSAGAGTDFTIAFDPTELLGNRTWGDASTDTIIWTWNRATGTDPTITFNNGSIALPALTLTTDLVVAEGGTGASTFTDGGPILGSGVGALTAMAVLGDGEIIIGDGVTDPVVLDVGSSTSITILGTIATGVWQGTAIADAYIPNTITIDLASLATTLTITDNEATAENNPLVFVAGGDLDGGDLGLETDGDAHYNPSTGTVTATEFVGGGSGLTLASTDLSDTAALLYETELDSFAELDTQIADKALINLADGGTFTGNIIANANLSVGNAGTTAGVLTLLEDDDDGANFASFMVPALVANTVYTLPPDDGDNTEVLQTNGAGVLTWVAAGVGDMTRAVYDSGLSGGVDVLTTVDSTYASDYVLLIGAAVGTNPPKTDGALTYDATSGTLAATQFSGGGASLTSIDAITGDSATAFFDAGTIEHEYGGLQANISAYTGLIAITGADTTAEIDSLDELEGQLADVTRIVSEAVMPVAGTDPDVDAAGELSVDTDGANEPNDVVLRSIDGGNTPLQIALAQQQKSFQATIIKPNDLADATRDLCPIWSNETGMSFVITKIEAWSDTDDTTLNVEVYDSVFGNNATVDALEIAGDGTANYYVTETTITANTIAANYIIALDFDDTDDPGWVKLSICGYFLSDVD